MGALIFYVAVYFIGYYAANLVNHIVGRVLIQNRRLAGLVLVLMVSLLHGYKIISTSPSHDHGEGAGYALGFYVILPVAIIGLGVLYLNWQEKQDNDIP
mgnify:CR=1 FL=1